MNNICTMAELDIGQSATVDEVFSEASMRRRLYDIGLIEGTCIECVLKSPGGNPMAYRVRGAVIALRNEDTEKITVLV